MSKKKQEDNGRSHVCLSAKNRSVSPINPNNNYYININVVLCVRPQYTGWESGNDGFDNQQQVSQAVADYFFICPTNEWAMGMSDAGAKVYYYYFTHVSTTCIGFCPISIIDWNNGDNREETAVWWLGQFSAEQRVKDITSMI